MNLPGNVASHAELANDLAGIAAARIDAASPVATLSDRDGKLLRLMEEGDSSRFVTRSYTQQAIEEIERKHGPFEEAWEGMHDAFRAVGIDLVRSHFIRTGEAEAPIVVISEYVGETGKLETASTDAKKRVAGALGSVLTSDTVWVPGSPMMRPDMFGVPVRDNDVSVLLDIDPFVVRRDPVVDDEGKAWYLGKLGRLFWDDWCAPEEREAVFSELVAAVEPLEIEEGGTGPISQQIQILRGMSQNVDLRKVG